MLLSPKALPSKSRQPVLDRRNVGVYLSALEVGRDGPRSETPCPESLGPSDNHGRYPFPPILRIIQPLSATNTAFVYIQYQCLINTLVSFMNLSS